jgi:hypothetical protein
LDDGHLVVFVQVDQTDVVAEVLEVALVEFGDVALPFDLHHDWPEAADYPVSEWGVDGSESGKVYL